MLNFLEKFSKKGLLSTILLLSACVIFVCFNDILGLDFAFIFIIKETFGPQFIEWKKKETVQEAFKNMKEALKKYIIWIYGLILFSKKGLLSTILLLSACVIFVCFNDYLGFRFAFIFIIKETFGPQFIEWKKKEIVQEAFKNMKEALKKYIIWIYGLILSMFITIYIPKIYSHIDIYYDYDYIMVILEVFFLNPIKGLLVPSRDILEHITYVLRDTFDDYSHYIDKNSPRQHYRIIFIDKVEQLNQLRNFEISCIAIAKGIIFYDLQKYIINVKYDKLQLLINEESRYEMFQVPIRKISEQKLDFILRISILLFSIFFSGIAYQKLSEYLKKLQGKKQALGEQKS